MWYFWPLWHIIGILGFVTKKLFVMSDVFKNFLYAGVGLAAMTTEKIQATVDELVEKGKISDSEGKKIVEDFLSNSEEKKSEFEEKLRSVSEEIIAKFDFMKNKEVDELKARVEELEAKLAEAKASSSSSKSSSKATADKK
jgi:polyhydroxyalkanoate synthesis regulator phasin